MTDPSATLVAIWFAAFAVIGAFAMKHEHPACVRIASVIDIAGDCGRK